MLRRLVGRLRRHGTRAERHVRGPRAPEARGVAAADWPSYNRTLAGDRFSPLDEIDQSNVAQLRVACTYTLPEVVAMQAGPIVVDGTMYFTTERGSYAIDAATCAEKWRVERQSSRPSPLGVQRGFAYLDGRLFRGTSDAHVLALDAADGRTLWDVAMDVAETPGVSMPMAPIAANGMVFIGNAGGDQTGVTGHVYALDARDGRVVWRFDVVPDEPAVRATWPNADRYPITGGAFWTSFALDTERGVLYVPAGNPAPDFDVEARGGDNLYTNSLIALDAATGRIVGYNQLVKRDEHDWDVNGPPALGVTRAGRPIVASANKDGLLSVLDRGALASAPPAGADLGARLPTIFQSATTTRENVDVPLSRTERVRFCPGIQGGNEWNGAAFHPALNTLYTGAVDWCANVQLAAAAFRAVGGRDLVRLRHRRDPGTGERGQGLDHGLRCGHRRRALEIRGAGSRSRRRHADGRRPRVHRGSHRTLARVRRRERRGTVRARDRPIDRRRNRQLFGRRQAEDRRGVRHEVGHLAGRGDREPDSGIRLAVDANSGPAPFSTTRVAYWYSAVASRLHENARRPSRYYR